jgi:hypothetical protein
MAGLRTAIAEGCYETFRAEMQATWQAESAS